MSPEVRRTCLGSSSPRPIVRTRGRRFVFFSSPEGSRVNHARQRILSGGSVFFFFCDDVQTRGSFMFCFFSPPRKQARSLRTLFVCVASAACGERSSHNLAILCGFRRAELRARPRHSCHNRRPSSRAVRKNRYFFIVFSLPKPVGFIRLFFFLPLYPSSSLSSCFNSSQRVSTSSRPLSPPAFQTRRPKHAPLVASPILTSL